MSRRRRRLIVGGIVLLLVFALAAWFPWSDYFGPPPVRAFARLRLGMTLDEVEAVIGEPATSYRDKTSLSFTSRRRCELVREKGLPEESIPLEGHPEDMTVELWYRLAENGYIIQVAFDSHGKAVGFHLFEDVFRNESPFRDWLRGFFGSRGQATKSTGVVPTPSTATSSINPPSRATAQGDPRPSQ